MGASNNHNKNIKSVCNYKPSNSTSLMTEQSIKGNKEKSYINQELSKEIQSKIINLQEKKTMISSNKNTISSIGNAKASSTLKNRRTGSSTVSSVINQGKNTPQLSSNKNLIAGYNKLVANNNEYFKKYNTEQTSSKNEVVITNSSNVAKPVIKIDLTSKMHKNEENKIEHCDGLFKETEITKTREKLSAYHSRRSSIDNNKNISVAPAIKVTEENIKVTKKPVKQNQLISNISDNFKNILQNSKMNLLQKQTKVLTNPNNKVATPKPEGDKILSNEVSKKSIIGSNLSKKPNMIQTMISSTHTKTSPNNNYNVEIKYGNNNVSKTKPPSAMLRPSSRISDKPSSVIKVKKQAQTSTNSPKSSTAKIAFPSKTQQSANEKKEKKEVDRIGENKINNITENKEDTNKNSYLKEAELLSDYIKTYYHKTREYPTTNLRFYKFGRQLGRGAFGKVNLGLHILSGKLVAIKSFNKATLQNEKAKKKILQEVKLMQKLKQNTVVKIYETFETQKYLIIIMEYISGGDLLSYVKKRNKLTEPVAKYIFRQIITSLDFTHNQYIIHRDIKLDNILLDIHGNIKICDFGVSKQVKSKKEFMYDQCGTPAYIAPEILIGNGYEGPPVDFWSAGVVLYAMLSGMVPFKATDMNELHRLIVKGEFAPIEGSNDVNNLLHGILEVDPKKRFTSEEILNHPWMIDEDEENGTNMKMELFGISEKILLAKSDIDYRKADKDNLFENFTLKNLDTKNDIHNKNIATKSHILAPFNSSLKDSLQDNYEYSELETDNYLMKLIGKVKEANHQYELNNNDEFDYGVIKKHNSKDKAEVKSGVTTPATEMFSGPLSPPDTSNRMSGINTPRSDSITHKNPRSNSLTTQTLVIDEFIIKLVEALGYNKEFILKSLNSNELNHATTCYFIMLVSKFNEENNIRLEDD